MFASAAWQSCAHLNACRLCVASSLSAGLASTLVQPDRSEHLAWIVSIAVAVASTTALAYFWKIACRKTAEVNALLREQGKVRKFDLARNQVLETIARSAPFPEIMERLALVLEQQFAGSLCAIVIPCEVSGGAMGETSPALIAPSLPERLQPAFAAASAATLVCEPSDSAEPAGELVAARLSQILGNSGMTFEQAHSTVLFSKTACMQGLLLLFVKNASEVDAERANGTILPWAARIALLAKNNAFLHERLLYEARHDSLTGLANRSVAEDRLEQALARAQRNSKSFAVLCIDLDGFKAINDERGHEAGDQVLCAIAARLRGRIRHSDTLARMGGDEFWAILEDCAGAAAAELAAQALLAALEQPICLESEQLNVSASVGVAMYPAGGRTGTQLKRHADEAMYRAKALGGKQIAFWSAAASDSFPDHSVAARLETEHDIARAE